MRKILDSIQTPADVGALDNAQLPKLCDEIRHELIETVSRTGGHLASNLGVVDLTVALHHVFELPRDTIVFDVGHQCYTHKLLTGRRAAFTSLRRKGGAAGFPKPAESEYDPFIAGHSSTSLSSAVGLVRARQIAGEDGKVVVILGDGAFAGGMVYEAINNIDSSMKNLIVILNDNSMSISKSVGALSRYLLRLRTKSGYSRLKNIVSRFLTRLPLLGRWLSRTLRDSKSALRRSLYGGTLFEELGFNYIGPVDGHDIEGLCGLFTNLRDMKGPLLVHVKTVKGKGFALAEENPGAYHGVGQFDLEQGNPDIADADSFSNLFGRTLCALADDDPSICAVTAAMKYATGLHYFSKHHRGRFFDVGIAEEHAVTFCGGLAAGGMKPVFSVYSTFLQRAFDQLAHDISLAQLPVMIAIDRAGLVGDDGETHQGLLDVAMLSAIGVFTVAAPANYAELEHWIPALLERGKPCALRYPRGPEDARLKGYGSTGQDFDLISGTSGQPVDRLFITYGREFAETLDAVQILKEKGIACDILKLNMISPISDDALEAAAGYGCIVFAEEGILQGGVGEHLLRRLHAAGYAGRYRIRAIEQNFVPHATVREQFEMFGLDGKSLAEMML